MLSIALFSRIRMPSVTPTFVHTADRFSQSILWKTYASDLARNGFRHKVLVPGQLRRAAFWAGLIGHFIRQYHSTTPTIQAQFRLLFLSPAQFPILVHLLDYLDAQFAADVVPPSLEIVICSPCAEDTHAWQAFPPFQKHIEKAPIRFLPWNPFPANPSKLPLEAVPYPTLVLAFDCFSHLPIDRYVLHHGQCHRYGITAQQPGEAQPFPTWDFDFPTTLVDLSNAAKEPMTSLLPIYAKAFRHAEFDLPVGAWTLLERVMEDLEGEAVVLVQDRGLTEMEMLDGRVHAVWPGMQENLEFGVNFHALGHWVMAAGGHFFAAAGEKGQQCLALHFGRDENMLGALAEAW
ncbi:MAG: hypothetical protein AAF570_01415, partial [Bacteroidota bacterium]